MPIEPNIALGVRPMEVPNPLAQYGQIAAIQNAQNQNALAQFQLGSARRQEEAQNALSQAYQQSINPETGQLDPKMLISNVAKSSAAHLLPDIQSKLLESQTKEATLKKTTQETEAGQFKLAQEKLKHGWMSMGEASTPQAAIEKLNDALEPIGFSVYGMSYTEDATCITLQLSNEMTEACGNKIFHYCQFSVINDGEFMVELDEAALDNGLSVRLTTPYDQHMFNNATHAEIDAAAANLQMALQTQLLKV